MLVWLLWLLFITFHGNATVQMYCGIPPTMKCAGHTDINIKSLSHHRIWWRHHEWTFFKKTKVIQRPLGYPPRVTPLGHAQCQVLGVAECRQLAQNRLESKSSFLKAFHSLKGMKRQSTPHSDCHLLSPTALQQCDSYYPTHSWNVTSQMSVFIYPWLQNEQNRSCSQNVQ